MGLGGISWRSIRSINKIPVAEILNHGGERRKRLEIQLRGRRLAAMASDAILIDKRPYRLRKSPF